jgi:tRNA dimethylallyltransferase
MIVILGPTATGKTQVAVQVAQKIDGEIISADSRQVFRGMTIGTGKDVHEYTIGNQRIPYHLIDIAEPGEEYSVFRFQQDFLQAWNDIRRRGKTPILCGGTGFYIESVLKQYRLEPVP